jgi:hypothetical protein
MIHTLIGKENFRKGMDKYFELFDGKAVTTEDFLHAMEIASGVDLSQFKNWYSRPGTPLIIVRTKDLGDELVLDIEQKYPPTTHKVPDGNVLHMPFVIGLLNKDTNEVTEKRLEIKSLKESFRFPKKGGVIPSLNRGFSAPVHIDYPYSISDLISLMSFENDPYCRFDATQKIYQHLLIQEIDNYKKTSELFNELNKDFVDAFRVLLDDRKIDSSFKSYLLELPSENTLSQEVGHPDFDAIHIGLTATPNVGELQWINEDERQLVKNTYLFYDCWDMVKKQGKPTFAYSLQDGIKEGFLANYEIYQAESKLTFEGAIWDENEIQFSDWGRIAESEDRLTLIIQEFFAVEEDRTQDHPRKTIVFSVGEKQAIILERLFNKLLPIPHCQQSVVLKYKLKMHPILVKLDPVLE